MRHLITPLLAAGVTVLSTAPASADLGDQLSKLLADDGAADDVFGNSVGISGTTAIVGAVDDGDNGFESGSAYLFDVSDPASPTQLFKLLAKDGAAEDGFGVSCAISGTTAIVGTNADDDNGAFSGSAYLFDITTGLQIAKLLPKDGAAFDVFGTSVAISGDIAIVGALRDDDNGDESGSAYLFDITTGLQIAKLLPNDGAAGDNFGFLVAINGATAIVGARLDDDNGDDSGSAYLFDISDPAKPTQIAKLLAKDGAADDLFGRAVAISPDGIGIAIVGAFLDDDNGEDSGSAYLFDSSTGLQIAKLLPDDGAAGDFFGISVAIHGAIAIVGAYQDADNAGSAYVFDVSDPAKPMQIFKLVPDDGATGDFFGWFIGISGPPGNEVAIVAAPFDDENGTHSGSAYLFDVSSCPWDLDNNGTVGASDLLALLFSWGPCKGCPADFDGNGSVGASDLLALLANWGPCL